MNWERKHLVWKTETKSWWAVGFGEEEEIYRPADSDHDKHDNEQEREREREHFKPEMPQWVRAEEDNLDQEFINFWIKTLLKS